MARIARNLLPWALLLLVLAGIPNGLFDPPFSATERPVGARMKALESENATLRADLQAVREQLDAIAQRTEALAVAEPTHLDVLERWPIPDRLDFAGEVVPLDDPAVYARLEDQWTRFLVNRHWLISWLRRSREVFPPVEARLAAAGLPDDLKYVVVVESGLRARAYSPAGAVGYWQFIRATGQRYGLRRDSWIDERRDLDASTHAAIAYLSEMYEEFQSWPLVLAGYNAGERRVRTAIEDQGSQDFYDLVLPQETESYWFKAVALKELLGHPERYDLHLPDDGWQVAAHDTLSLEVTEEKLDFREIAAAMDMGYRELKELNPQYRRSWLPRGSHRLVLPRDGVEPLLASFPSARVLAAAPSSASDPAESGADGAAGESADAAAGAAAGSGAAAPGAQSSSQSTSARN